MVTPANPWRLAALALATLAACADPPSVLLTLEHPASGDAGFDVRRFEITPRPSGGTAMATHFTPQDPGDPLGASETVRLVFDRSLAGKTLGIEVRAFDYEAVAVGKKEVTLTSGEVALTLAVVACGCHSHEECTLDGCRCGAADCASDQECVNGACQCTAQKCPEGCCDATQHCQTGATNQACGTGGEACKSCEGGVCAAHQCIACQCPEGCCDAELGCVDASAMSAKACGAKNGACLNCTLGSGDACDADGACTCGAGPGCAAGTHCVSGACVCDPTTCKDGCCSSDNKCHSPPTLAACGTAGESCTACGFGADACSSEGACRCGSGPECGPGLHCVSGACQCDATSCSGCCGPTGCVEVPSALACGKAGGECKGCDSTVADRCLDGACSCNGGPACADGQRCTGAGCVCDPTSCPDGCCSGNVCQGGDALSMCGTGGAPCAVCDSSSDGCVAGACVCGSGPACKTGTVCSAGACACDQASCTGCCEASGCATSTFDHCGAAGAPCVTCDLRSNQCQLPTGECGCNGGPPCETGLHCTATGCVCDPASCPSGCCSASGCESGTTALACGKSGGACQTCDPQRSDGCTAGACTCKGGAACAAGQRCTAAGCVCDTTSCTTGCCQGKTCTGLGTHTCAPPGTACQDCADAADGCSPSGECTCGGGPACASGQNLLLRYLHLHRGLLPFGLLRRRRLQGGHRADRLRRERHAVQGLRRLPLQPVQRRHLPLRRGQPCLLHRLGLRRHGRQRDLRVQRHDLHLGLLLRQDLRRPAHRGGVRAAGRRVPRLRAHRRHLLVVRGLPVRLGPRLRRRPALQRRQLRLRCGQRLRRLLQWEHLHRRDRRRGLRLRQHGVRGVRSARHRPLRGRPVQVRCGGPVPDGPDLHVRHLQLTARLAALRRRQAGRLASRPL
ncbi:MAG: hypothetical protein QM765_02425 [Myxococcales bacterium]